MKAPPNQFLYYFTMKSELNTTTEDTLWENKFLNHLQFIASTLGLAIPNLYSYRGLSVWYIFYSIIVIALIVAMFVIALLNWIDLFQVKVLGTTIVLNCMCLTIMTVSNVVAIVFAVMMKRKSVVQLVKQLKDIDKATAENNWPRNYNKSFTKVFVVMHVCILLQVLMHMIFYTIAFGMGSLTLSVLNGSLMYVHMINVLQISSFPIRINHRCIALNEVLNDLLTSSQKATQVQEIHKILNDTRLLLKIYDSICDMFEFVSRCYGIQMILVVCVSVIFIVEGFNVCIKYSLQKIHLVHKEHEYPMLFINLCKCTTFAVRFNLLKLLVVGLILILSDSLWSDVNLLCIGYGQNESC